ncbi:MAG: hypothetical protein K2X64_02750, partial [Rhodocyclaceae bacterium]|nr:hypothetical protein [Rhodocyclaceae bacterium]
LGPWVNSKRINWFTAGIIAVLVMLSVILTAAVLFPDISDAHILGVLVGGSVLGVVLAFGVKLYEKRKGIQVAQDNAVQLSQVERDNWRMPAMETLTPARLSLSSRMWMLVLRGYLVIAAGLLMVKLVVLAIAN